MQMQKRWIQQPEADVGKVTALSEALGVNAIIARLLVNRGIESFDDAHRFFRPQLAALHDPFEMKDMQAAVNRIGEAIAAKEKILIYGDYDVDGTTAVAVVYGFLSRYCNGIGYYIPDRYKEGYGISISGIDYASSKGYSLIIALDCGIKSVREVAYAKELGIDFIIGDHHLPESEWPAACAVLDPKRPDCSYPFKELSGCGIGFKLIQAFAKEHRMDELSVMAYLDLVAVSIAADMVPLTGENRILAHYGMKKLNSEPCAGLRALMKQCSEKSFFTLADVVFQIAPRINAAGRIKHGEEAVQLLTTANQLNAEQFGAPLNDHNLRRKEVDTQITAEALAIIAADSSRQKNTTTVVFKQDWHKGVIGIVASRLTESYYRPTVVLTAANGAVTGSARSVEGFDLYDALHACGSLLEQFGGHRYAAGLTMKPENVEAFSQLFEEVVASRIHPDQLVKGLTIHDCVPLKAIDARFLRILKQFEPFGTDNPQPLFMSCGVYAVGHATLINQKHLKMVLRQEGSPPFEAIGFQMSEYDALVNSGAAIDICYTVEENNWRNKTNIQLNLKGIRLAGSIKN
ncbi:exonuclease RecJ [bacterium A37T11]|nr:exonuclease RecJ [bacterium A37T11]